MRNKKFIHEIKNECTTKTTFIILCAKKSNKRGYKNIPLFPTDTGTLIDNQINTILSVYKKSDIIIVSGFEYEKTVNHINATYENVRIVENQNYKNSDILDGWKIGLNLAVRSNVYIIHGDRSFSKECINGKNRKTHLITHTVDNANYNLGLLYDENNMLLNISYGLPDVWSEIFYIGKKDFTTCRNLINESKNNRIYNLDGFINLLADHIEISVVRKDSKNIKTLKDI